MVDLNRYKKMLLEKNPQLSNEIAEAIVVIYFSNYLDSFGEEFLSTAENAMATTSFIEGGNETKFSCSLTQDGALSNVVTIRNDYNDENINHVGELTSAGVSSMCSHYTKEGNTLIYNDGLATITYDISNGIMEQTSSSGVGLQEGLESYLLECVMRDNRSNSYSTSKCIYQEILARWLMENGFREEMLIGAFTGNTTLLEEALGKAGIDYNSLKNAADKLKAAEQARQDGKKTRNEVNEIFVGISPLLNGLLKENRKSK